MIHNENREMNLNLQSPSFSKLKTISPALIIDPSFRLYPLSKKVKFFMGYPEIVDYKPISNAIRSAGEIFYECTNENVNIENLNKEIKNLNNIINISEHDMKLLTTVRERKNFISQLNHTKENFQILEKAAFLTSFGEYHSRRKSILSSIITIKNACEWGISGKGTDHAKFVESVYETCKEIDALKNAIITKSFQVPVQIDEFQNGQNANKGFLNYISGRPNEGITKNQLGSEEIISITKDYAYYLSESGKRYSFDLIKTRTINGYNRYIFKIGTVYVAGILIDKNYKTIGSYVESYLNEIDTLDILNTAIKRDRGMFNNTT